MQQTNNKKLLIYTVCNKEYEMFIPIFCLSHLLFNDDIDIEIGISSLHLSSSIECCLDIIRKNFQKSIIRIDYGVFDDINGKAIVNGNKLIYNSVRFIVEPFVKNEYTYITDIDIICCEKISDMHINDMEYHNSQFSNIVRTNTTRLSGLHFTKTSAYYPVNIDNISSNTLCGNDEMLLYEIIKNKGIKIDHNRTFRPVHGIHMSLNRPNVEGSNNIPGWGAQVWRKQWFIISKSKIYGDIYELLDDKIIVMVSKLEKYYESLE